MCPLYIVITNPGGQDREWTTRSGPSHAKDPVTGIRVIYGGDYEPKYSVINRDGSVAGIGEMFKGDPPRFVRANKRLVDAIEHGQPKTEIYCLVRLERSG